MDGGTNFFVLADLFAVGADEEGHVVHFPVGQDIVAAGEEVGLVFGGEEAEAFQHAVDGGGENFGGKLFVASEPGAEAEGVFGQGDGATILVGGLFDEVFE